MIELYAHEYARLEFERAQLNCGQPGDDEALRRIKSLQRKLRKREFERLVTEQRCGPAVKRGVTALRLGLLKHKGIDIAKRLLLSVLSARGPRGAARKENKR